MKNNGNQQKHKADQQKTQALGLREMKVVGQSAKLHFEVITPNSERAHC